MSFETVLYAVADGVARITLNRPDKHNALNRQLLDDLDAAFSKAEADDGVTAIVLAGAGPSFCSGYDLRGGSYYINPPDGAESWKVETAMAALDGIEARYLRIWNCPKVTIAQLHGNVLASGCYLQLLCDISVAAEDARIGHPAPSGHVGASSMPLWQAVMPLKKARYLLFTKRLIDGLTAERWGLVSLAVPAAELAATVDAVAADCVRVSSPRGARYQKAAYNTAFEMGVGPAFRYLGQMNALGRVAR